MSFRNRSRTPCSQTNLVKFVEGSEPVYLFGVKTIWVNNVSKFSCA